MGKKAVISDTGVRWRYVLQWMEANGWEGSADGRDWTRPTPVWMRKPSPPWAPKGGEYDGKTFIFVPDGGAAEPMSACLVDIAHCSEVPLGRMIYEIMTLQLSAESPK